MSAFLTEKISKRQLMRSWAPAFTILLVALVIRLVGLGAESAWIDEGYSLSLASHSIQEIIRGTAADQHPPLYYLLLHFWLILGASVYNARLLSVIFGMLNVYQVLKFGTNLGGQWLGYGTATLIAINPMHIWYSQEARQYMMLAVFTTASTMELWNCLQGKRQWFFYGLFTVLSIYTHYFASFVVLTHGLFIVAWTIHNRIRQLIVNWVITMIGVVLTFLPWIQTAINQFFFHTMPWISDPGIGDIRDIPLRLILGSGVLILPNWFRWLGMILFFVISAWTLGSIIIKREASSSSVVFMASWALLPYFAISMVSLVYPVFQFKQFLFLIPPFLLLATLIAGLFKKWWKYLVFFFLFIIPLFSLAYQQIVPNKDDWRGLSVYVGRNISPGDIVYTNPAGASLVLDLYLDPSIPVDGYPPDFDILTGGWKGQPITEEVTDQLLTSIADSSNRIWLVEFFPEFWDPGGLIPAWLESHTTQVDDQYFGNIHMRLFQIGHFEP